MSAKGILRFHSQSFEPLPNQFFQTNRRTSGTSIGLLTDSGGKKYIASQLWRQDPELGRHLFVVSHKDDR